MEREANPDPVAPPASSRAHPDERSSTSFSSSSSPELLRNFQAAFKRHRPLVSGAMQGNNLMPKRAVLPQRARRLGDAAPSAAPVGPTVEKGASRTSPDGSAITLAAAATSTVIDCKRDDSGSNLNDTNPTGPGLSSLAHQLPNVKRKVQFSTASNPASQGADDRMATGLDNISSHMGSLALTEMEWDLSSRVDTLSSVVDNESKYRNVGTVELDSRVNSSVASMLGKRTAAPQDELHSLQNFLIQPATQSSVVGVSCATTTLVHSTSAPMISSTTYSSQLHQESGPNVAFDSLRDYNANFQHKSQGSLEQFPAQPNIQRGQIANTNQALISEIDSAAEVFRVSREQHCTDPKSKDSKNHAYVVDKPTKERESSNDVGDVQAQAQASMSKNPSLDSKSEPPKADKQEKIATSTKGASGTRKRNYDPDLFFKVNGKLYQRLGKIGSGGSSEVHKVISSDCTIYALKKIKLKGRDYATAIGFCQEIEYLNKLKGKTNIIQLIDYEVTDKALLREVTSGCMTNKDTRVKDDGYIYMVLEYGEIDLAHMLSQKWKEMDGSNQTLDENWLRFYWQQILEAVKTIHEERIVHSDLKPANFLLVKGSLKLIDFGIAKAIMSDTTNIQRDSQVGTLSYMSPEAFLCNESDDDGNIIKCGRPSDIWSLGCILYQMVYGRTPFAEYKTFWAKLKVITDPNHEIIYEPVPNPWLLDLMKKCLAWDRNDRWRIPQLLQHPFIVPPIPSQPALSQEESCELLELFAKVCSRNQEASEVCNELQQLLGKPNKPSSTSHSPEESDYQQRKFLLAKLRHCLTK